MSPGVDNPEEDSTEEFEGLHDKLVREPVSQDQADARVADLLQKHLEGRQGPFQYVIDGSFPPETVIKVSGANVFLSPDAAEAILRHHQHTKQRPPFVKPRKVGEPYRGS